MDNAYIIENNYFSKKREIFANYIVFLQQNADE